jgi:hypothetical protein
VSDRFAAVAYVSGPELKADVVFHNAPQAAAGMKWAEFVEVCTLSKLLVAIGTDGGSKQAIAVPGELLLLPWLCGAARLWFGQNVTQASRVIPPYVSLLHGIQPLKVH